MRFADDYVVGFEHREDARAVPCRASRTGSRNSAWNWRREDAADRVRQVRRRRSRGAGSASLRRSSSSGSRIFAGHRGIRTVSSSCGYRLKAGATRTAHGQDASIGEAGTCPSQNRADGSPASCPDITAITPCPTTSRRSTPSATSSSGTGSNRCGRRSQRLGWTWKRMDRLAEQWLPRPRIMHPWPEQRFAAITQSRSPVR